MSRPEIRPFGAPPGHQRTSRLDLRRPEPGDLDSLCRFDQNPQVMATLGGLRPADRTAAALDRLMADWRRDGFGWWILHERATGRFAGRGGLRLVSVEGRDEVEIGYGFLPEFWGQGLATELARFCVELAFEHLNLARVVAFTLPTNRASQRVMEKAGLTYERAGTWANLPHVFYAIHRGQDGPPARLTPAPTE